MAFYKQQIWQESVSAVTTTASVDLGTRRIVDGSEYVYCYNGATVADKRSVVRPLTAGVAYTFSVTTTSNSVQPIIGVIANATCAASSYCWVLTKGYTKGVADGSVTYAVGGALAPVRIITGADGTISIPTGGTGSTGLSIGWLTSAVSDCTATSVGVYINSPF